MEIENIAHELGPYVSALERHKPSLMHLRRWDIREVVLICASSRGGSSLLFDLLSSSRDLVKPRGEHTPFEKLFIGEHPDDALYPADFEPARADLIWRLLRTDLRTEAYDWQTDPEVFRRILQIRLPMQWPKVTPRRVGQLFDKLMAHEHPWHSDFFYGIVSVLHDARQISSGFYDAAMSTDRLALSKNPMPPHNPPIIEEPPFISIFPAELVGPEAATRPLLLKSSLNAYRLGYYQRFFPNAKIKVIHLTRNPAASINGLMDGWRHWGFFSHNLPHTWLKIDGYSERNWWGRRWWNFDRFPGWHRYFDSTLPAVCAQQWLSAHRSIMDHLDEPALSGSRTLANDWIRVKYEDMIRGGHTRQIVLDHLCDFMGIHRIDAGDEYIPSKQVMATKPPTHMRWKKREKQIIPQLNRPRIMRIAERMGYSQDITGPDWI